MSKVEKLPIYGCLPEDGLETPIVYKQVVAYDENGEIVYDMMKRPRHQNGGGFVISYTEKVCDFLQKFKTGSVVRLFLFLAHHQQYGSDGDTRTITLRNPKANITTEQIQDLNTLIQANNILLGDKTSATFGRIQSVKRITRTKTQIEI